MIAAGDARAIASAGEVRVIAFYLPQYHAIPENDRWWGKGFTEWTNVRRARPNFAGHYQPHVAGELGYYDLRDPAVQERQATLARAHGVHGFCYYYYWFNGKRLLEQPLDAMVVSGVPDFPFCVCWANENWTRRWDGLDHEVLIAQDYSPADTLAFIRGLLPLFADPRYIRVDGRPLLIVYKPDLIPNLAETARNWRRESIRAGAGDPYLCLAWTSWHGDPRVHGFDAAVEFPPHGTLAENLTAQFTFSNPDFAGMVLGYRNYVAQLMMRPRPDFPLFRTVIPAWDNTARRQDRGTTFVGSSPEVFGYWLEQVIEQTRYRHQGDERLIFINAWNEWGEGCHLEPDARYGRQYLEALRAALAAPLPVASPRPAWTAMLAVATARERSTRRVRSAVPDPLDADGPLVSVVMPAYNHARFVGEAIGSVLTQTHRALELIVVDDGSTDDTGAIADELAARCTTHPVTVIHQPNGGAADAINHGMALARGDFIAIINSDDRYAPGRIAALVAAMRGDDAGLAFSGTRFIDDDDVEYAAESAYVRSLRDGIAALADAPDPLYALLKMNAAISTGNLMFRRTLVEANGGFSALRVCHDWEYLLAASYRTRIAWVPAVLYDYRVHRANTYQTLRLTGHMEVERVFERFFAVIDTHPVMQEPASAARFIAHVASIGLAGYLPPPLRDRAAFSQK